MAIKRAADAGRIIQYARGVYVSAEGLATTGISLAATSLLLQGVVCLGSAAQFHGLSDEDPPEIWYAVDRGRNGNMAAPSIRQPHRLVWWPAELLEVGVNTVQIAGVDVRFTSPARTVVDLIRYRGKLGEETAAKALADYVRSGADLNEIWDIAEAIGVKDALTPFLRVAEELAPSIAALR
ncbi:type IV toxin-antitoxin system AbiEi family antitoxin domain-containing protein [Chenggangzhangella methanolivorans]|nr:type IV toxin-antitoxin system AbiEi family antitoxin [Chenggangzhangella methanolivorans]QZO02238.1 type IV toxin-antitoxin system AbiEi family antitoxin [Chenggangzhangella methanolivorans]